MAYKALVLGEISDGMPGSGEWSEALAQISTRHCASVEEALQVLNSDYADCLLLFDSDPAPEPGDSSRPFKA